MSRLLIALLLSAASALAQVSTATLTGIVSDPSEARLASVALQLINDGTGVTLSAATNAQGEYTFPLLNPGRYRLTATASGFQPATRTGITLELGRVSRLDLTLQLGQVAESVDVSGTAPLLESETATVGQFIENKTIVDMPLNGRRVGQLLALMGNAVYIQGDVIRPRVTIAGSRSDSQQWMLDGVNASNIALEVSQALFNPPVEAVQEIRVQQNSYSAEFGNSAAGVVSMTTRSGTNKFTALAYEYFRNEKLDARNFFAASRPPLRYNVFGWAAGGPVYIPKVYDGRNRTFFFSHVEFQKQRLGVVRNLTVPTAIERAGDFSRTLTAAGAVIPVFDPLTTRTDAGRQIRTQFAGNVIPASRVDPVAAKVITYYPASNRAASNLAGANNFIGNSVNVLDITTWTSRVDHTVTDKDRVSARIVVHDFPTNDTAVFAEPAADPNASFASRRAFSYTFNYLRNFSASTINDIRFNWQPRRFHTGGLGLGEGWPAKLGVKGVSEIAFPQFTAAGYVNIGAGTHERVQIPIHDTHLVDALSWYKGSHSLRFGGEVRLSRNVDDFKPTASGSFGFNPQGTGNPGVNNTGSAIASLLLGWPNAGSRRETELLDRRAKYLAGFVQDDWKATQSLTVNVGLRWEAHTPRFDQNDRQSGFDPAAINPVSGTPGVVTFAGKDGLGRNVYNGDYNNWTPRIGLAWKARPNMVVRSGYGIFFGPPLPGSNNTSAGYEISGSFNTPDLGITPPFLLRDGLPAIARAAQTASFGAVRVGQGVVFAPEFIERNRRIGYSQQWNLVVQHDLGWQTLVELSYLGNVGRKLPGPNTNINQIRPEQLGPGNAQIRRPFPQFNNVTLVTPFWGNSSYHGANIKVEKRFSQGLNFLVNYTHSKFIDDVTANQEIGVVGGGIQNFYDRRAEKALSGNDVRNRIAASSVYELPVGKKRKWLTAGPAAAILGGWGLGTIVTLQDGSPNGLVTQVNNTNAFGGSQRVNVLRDPSLPKSERTIARYFDTSAVAAPAQFTFGNAGRALFTGPGVANVDISLLKNHLVGERFNVQIRVESFNAFNRVNLEDPGRALGSPQFGVISATSRNARNLQLGIKLTY